MDLQKSTQRLLCGPSLRESKQHKCHCCCPSFSRAPLSSLLPAIPAFSISSRADLPVPEKSLLSSSLSLSLVRFQTLPARKTPINTPVNGERERKRNRWVSVPVSGCLDFRANELQKVEIDREEVGRSSDPLGITSLKHFGSWIWVVFREKWGECGISRDLQRRIFARGGVSQLRSPALPSSTSAGRIFYTIRGLTRSDLDLIFPPFWWFHFLCVFDTSMLSSIGDW